jgi:hypothetical protein
MPPEKRLFMDTRTVLAVKMLGQYTRNRFDIYQTIELFADLAEVGA